MLKYIEEFRDKEKCLLLAKKINDISNKRFRIMEVCGGHTMAIRKNGLNQMVGDNIKLISGPGCPVCVSSTEDINKAIVLSAQRKAAVCTFGDLFYVPGTLSRLSEEKAKGYDVRLVYSVFDVLQFARDEKDKDFVFVSIGFETTAPTTAAAVIQADKENLENFSVLVMNKTMPNAMRTILDDRTIKIDAFICPGHVSTITGSNMFKFIPDEFDKPCCVSGFEPMDILRAVYLLAEMFESGRSGLMNAYERAVTPEGNIKALDILHEVFEPADASWRGLGVIPDSGLKLKTRYKKYDAESKFSIDAVRREENPNCICGNVLKGKNLPSDCSLFGRTCTPEDPVGACMVSSEGACAAWYKYGE